MSAIKCSHDSSLFRVVNTTTNRNGMIRQDKGSGVLIGIDGEQFVLSAAHVFRAGVGRITLATRDEKQYSGTIALRDADWDVVLLRLSERVGIREIILAGEATTRDEETVAWGFGPDGTIVGRQGRVVGYVRTTKTGLHETLKTTGRAREGDSGGPVLNRRGELVGLLWGTDGQYTYSTWSGRIAKIIGKLSVQILVMPMSTVSRPPAGFVPARNRWAPIPAQTVSPRRSPNS